MIAAEVFERARAYLFSRQKSYRKLFLGNGIDGKIVLEDLSKFCRAHKSTAHADPYIAARLDGRREVFLRIQEHLQLSEEEVWRLYGNPTLSSKGD